VCFCVVLDRAAAVFMQQVREEQVKLDGLNVTLDRLNNVLEEMTRK
jgi:hypothetical protein